MKLLMLTRYGGLGSSSRVRAFQYIPFLESHGCQVTVQPLLSDNYINALYDRRTKSYGDIIFAYLKRLFCLLQSFSYDILWVEKELFPWLPSVAERIITRLGIPIVVDYDDATFHNYDIRLKGPLRFCLRNKVDRVMRTSSLVVVGNQYLADRASRAGAKNIEILPSVVDLSAYPRAAQKNSGEALRIGWIGSPVTAKYLRLVSSALEICSDRMKTEIILVGSGDITLKNVRLTIHPWCKETEFQDVSKFDVGIMPLPDESWERGKCGYKLIQYMACCLPVVASPVGVNREIVEHGVNGYLASSTTEWVNALSRLSHNQNTREKFGFAGRKKVEKKYSLQATAPRLLELLLTVRDKKPSNTQR